MLDTPLPIALPIEKIAAVWRRFRVRELSLFGSALGESFRPGSDYDLLVEFEPGTEITFLTLGQMERELELLLGRPIDLIPKNGLKPSIRQSVLDSAHVLYAA